MFPQTLGEYKNTINNAEEHRRNISVKYCLDIVSYREHSFKISLQYILDDLATIKVMKTKRLIDPARSLMPNLAQIISMPFK